MAGVAEELRRQPLFRSSTVAIDDVRCRARAGGCGAEERSTAHSIAFVRSGVFVKQVGSRQVVADANQAVFFNRHEAYRVSHPVTGGDDCTTFWFAPDVLLSGLGVYEPAVRERPDKPFLRSGVLLDARTALLQRTLRRCLRAGWGDGFAVDARSLDLLAAVLRATFRSQGRHSVRVKPETARVHRRWADATQVLLASRCGERLSLDEVARSVHCSPFHLVRIFRRETGIPIHRYLNRLRLRASLERLVDGGSDLTNLAMDLGYASHSHFTDAFRREFGVPPSDFRRGLTGGRLREMSKNLEA